MVSYTLTLKAVEDLSEIWDHPFQVWSEAQADKYYNALIDLFQELADGKTLGKNYPDVRTDIFGIRSGQHIVFYRKLKADQIEITRILHNRMDLKNQIQE